MLFIFSVFHGSLITVLFVLFLLQQALRVCRNIEAMTYVETSAKTNPRSVKDALEMAAMAGMGKLNNGKTFSLLSHRISLSSSSIGSGMNLSASGAAKQRSKSRFDLDFRSGRQSTGRVKHCVLM